MHPASPDNANDPFRIFAIDDDSGVRDALACLFKAADYRFTGFASAEAFLNQEVQTPRGCLVLDVELPGMSGLELQKLLRNQRAHRLPTIFISSGNSDYVERAFKGGASGFFHKPFAPEDLLRCVERLV